MKYLKQIALLLLMSLSVINIYSQNQNIDSLINVLNNNSLTDKEQMTLCYKIADRYVLFDLNKAFQYSERGLKLAEKIGDKSMASKFNASFGRIYNTKSSYDTAFVYWNKALTLAVAAKDKEQEASVNVGIGVLYGRQEQQALALEYFIKALSIYEDTGNKQGSLPILGNIGTIYRGMDNDERAAYYLEKARSVAEDIDFAGGKMQIYYELSALYYTQNKIDQALEFAQKAYNISLELNDKAYRGASTEVLTSIYYEHLKDYDIAQKYADECLQLAQEINDSRMILGAWKTTSSLLFAKEQYKESRNAAQKALEIDSTNINIAIDLYENIVLSNILLDNKDAAVVSFQQYLKIMAKYIDQSNREILVDMEIKYETEKKEARIVSLEKEQQLYVWLGIIGILLLFALSVVLWLTKKNARKERQLIATRSVLDGEMGERSRLAQDLHDRLSGSLAAIKIGLNSNQETLQAIQGKLDNCIEEVRRIAHNLRPVSLQYGLKAALEDFAAQFPNVQFRFFGEEKRIDERIELVVYSCVSELINNSIRHSKAENINLQMVQSGSHISFTVQDDGSGFDEKTIVKGIGLKSIRDRVVSCNGKIDISSSPGKGTETTIELKMDN